MTERLNNPERITKKEIDAIISKRRNPIIQFSHDLYSPSLLSEIDGLCEFYGEELEVRFYGHYKKAFNVEVLRYLPSVANLSLDCLQYIENHEELGRLDNLKSLSFGVYHFDDKEFLSRLNLKPLRRIVIGENQKKNFDLSYLSACQNLEELFIVGHTKNIDVLASLSKIKKLSLSSIGKKQKIQFVNKMAALDSLKLILGGRESFEEVDNPNLTKIEIIRVRGLEKLGDLGRFSKLAYLHIQDQIKIQEISINRPLDHLTDLKIITCKGLKRLNGIQNLRNISSFRIYNTEIEVNDILSSELPKSLKVFAFYTGKAKKDKEIRDILDKRDFSEFG